MDKELIENAFKFLHYTALYSHNQRIVGDYTKKYGEAFRVQEFTADIINATFRIDLIKGLKPDLWDKVKRKTRTWK